MLDQDIQRIALAYKDAKDELLTISDYNIHNYRQLINAQFGVLSDRIYFDFVNEEPYPYESITELEKDFRNRIIKVNTTGNDSALWGKVYNLQFRAIHDWIHCVHDLNFNFKDEVRAYKSQVEYSLLTFGKQFSHINWELYKKVLRSEIVYQAAVKEYFKEFHIKQKIILQDL